MTSAKHLKIFAVIVSAALLCACQAPSFHIVKDGQITRDGKPEYFVGTNMWYAPRLAVENPARLQKELDFLASHGINNLRVLAVEPRWEEYDAFFAELDKRDMSAVLFMNNAWEWSKGYLDYLELAGFGKQPRPSTDGYDAYMSAMSHFLTSREAQELSWDFVREMVSRYKDEPAVFSWQICNEPRCFSSDPAVQDAFVEYIHSTAALIKSIDPRHMVSTGNEGTKGCEESIELYKRINDCPDIDYVTIHIWPYNWGWVSDSDVAGGVQNACDNVSSYLKQHLYWAEYYGKPIVVEEFGFPRDGFVFTPGSPVSGRDAVYGTLLRELEASAREGGNFAGVNFWAWGGFAEPSHLYWEEGDDYCGDPFQEQQGLNSVFACDETTLGLVDGTLERIAEALEVKVPLQHDWIWAEGQKRSLDAYLYCAKDTVVTVTFAAVKDLSFMSEKQDTAYVQNITASLKAGCGRKVCFDLSGLAPGFYGVDIAGNPRFNIGIEPEKIVSPQDKQPDFDEFWKNTLDELSQVPLEPEFTLVPEYSDGVRELYKVEFLSLGNERMGGYVSIPVAPGKYPAVVEYMGYGAEPFCYSPDQRPGAIEFLVSVRGQGIFRESEGRWIDRGLESRENFYYRGAFCDVVRALDFICSLEKTDTDRVVVTGESQGGAFTWVAASLDHRVKAIVPAVPFLGDYSDYSKIVWWPVREVFQTADAQGIPREDLFRTLSYFDVKNFTDKVRCPVLMAFGLQDPTCPPHTNFSGYNMVSAPKQWYCAPFCGHGMWEIPQWKEMKKDFIDNNIYNLSSTNNQ